MVYQSVIYVYNALSQMVKALCTSERSQTHTHTPKYVA